MAYIKKKSERKFKITVCNGYKVNGQKRMKAQTITVPSSVPKRGIQQYVMAEAERIEKKFKYIDPILQRFAMGKSANSI